MDDRYAHLKIKDYEHWSLYLFDNQSYLGRMYLWAHRTDDVDITDMTPEEREEFFVVCKSLKTALGELFSPARLNYAALSNDAHHLHVHVIPRYDDDRVIDGVVFSDKNKGKAPWPYDRTFKTSPELLEKIRQSIAERL